MDCEVLRRNTTTFSVIRSRRASVGCRELGQVAQERADKLLAKDHPNWDPKVRLQLLPPFLESVADPLGRRQDQGPRDFLVCGGSLSDLVERTRPVGVPRPHLDLHGKAMDETEGVHMRDQGVGAALARSTRVFHVLVAIQSLEEEHTGALELGPVKAFCSASHIAVSTVLRTFGRRSSDGGGGGSAVVAFEASSRKSAASESTFHMRPRLAIVCRRRAETASSNGWIGLRDMGATGRVCP